MTHPTFRHATLPLLLVLAAGCKGNLGDTEDTGTTDDQADEGYDYGAVFDSSVVHRLDIAIDASDWQAMQDDMVALYGEPGSGPTGPGGFSDTDPMYVPVDISFDDTELSAVGMRFKGNSTLSGLWREGNRKLPFRLNMDKFEDDYPETEDQKLFGFDELCFSAMWHDDAQLREAFAFDLFEANGVPSAAWSYTRVYVDVGDGPEYWGLYTMIEDPSDNPFRDRVFGDDSGNMYKPEGPGADWTSFNSAGFEKKTNEDEADWSDVQAAITALNAPPADPDAWRADLEATFDVETFLTWLAVNTVMKNWDAYGGAPHNYYLYGDPLNAGQLVWVPWDLNEALTDHQGPPGPGGTTEKTPVEEIFFTNVGPNWPLIQKLVNDPIYAPIYEAAVVDATSGAFSEEEAAAHMQELHDLIAPYVVGADGEEPGSTTITSEAAFEASVQELTSYVRDRHALVDAALAAH